MTDVPKAEKIDITGIAEQSHQVERRLGEETQQLDVLRWVSKPQNTGSQQRCKDFFQDS